MPNENFVRIKNLDNSWVKVVSSKVAPSIGHDSQKKLRGTQGGAQDTAAGRRYATGLDKMSSSGEKLVAVVLGVLAGVERLLRFKEDT